MVRKYEADIVKHKNLIDNIYTLEFKSTGKKFKYQPGQFLHIAIDQYDGVGQWPESRCFSMQSQPKQDTLKITYAAKGEYTKRMCRELKEGNRIWLKMPYGNLFQNEHSKSDTVFIAGGTGITPYLSLFLHDSFLEYENPVLFFGLREKKYNLYEEELAETLKLNPSFTVRQFIESINGRPDIEEMLEYKNSEFFISGPPTMISFYKTELIARGIEPKRILTDDWE